MSDASGAAPSPAPTPGGRLPSTFGEKLSFGAPVLLVTLALAVLVAFVLVWIVSGNLRDEFQEAKVTLEQKNDKLQEQLSAEQTNRKELQLKVADLETKNAELTKKSEEVKVTITTALGEIDKKQEAFSAFDAQVETFMSGQKDLDARQNVQLHDHDQKIRYIEDKLKVISKLETEVDGLKGDTAGLKQDYVALKGNLERVRKKSDITQEDLDILTEQSRVFQLKVLQARAREAAEAARQGDLKALLRSLSEE